MEARVQQQLRGLPAAAVPPPSLAAHADRDDARQPEQVLRSSTETRWHMQSSWVVVFVLSWQASTLFSYEIGTHCLALRITAFPGTLVSASRFTFLWVQGSWITPSDANDTST